MYDSNSSPMSLTDDSKSDSNYVKLTADTDVYTNGISTSNSTPVNYKRNLSTAAEYDSTSNMEDVVLSSYDPNKIYGENTSQGKAFAYYASQTAIPPTSSVEPVCFPGAKEALYKPKEYRECQNAVWSYIGGNLEKKNNVTSSNALLILDSEITLPDHVIRRIYMDGGRRLDIYIKRSKCINIKFWKTMNLSNGDDDNSNGNGNSEGGIPSAIYFIGVIFIILILIAVGYYVVKRA